MQELKGVQGKAGWLETLPYPGEGGKEGPPVALVAVTHEFGYPEGGIPSRPFMRPAIAAHAKDWFGLLGQGAKAILNGTNTPMAVMELVAMRAAADIAEAISQVTEPPLKDATIAAKKGETKPLYETGHLITTVTGIAERS